MAPYDRPAARSWPGWLLALAAGLVTCCSADPVPGDLGPPDLPMGDVTLAPDSAADSGADLGPPVPDGPPPVKERLIILHTNDLHDQLLGFSPNADYSPATAGDDSTVGGLARLAALIKQERAAAAGIPVLTVDGGDSLIGTLFTWLNPQQAPTFSLMGDMGYDATTLGNHELEWTTPALAKTLGAAVAHGMGTAVVASNIKFSSATGDDDLEALKSAGVIVPYVVKQLPNGLRVGIFGLLGKAASGVAHGAAPVTFADPVATATQMVTELRGVHAVDLVICLSHSGIDATGKGEDAALAAAVPGIDVIISGHTHDALPQPVKVGSTLVVQTGKYGQKLGRMDLKVSGGTVTLQSYKLVAVDDAQPGDSTVQQKIDGYIQTLDTVLAQDNLAHSKVLAHTTFDLMRADFQESTIGDLVTDAYRFAATAADPAHPAALAFESNGVIRSELRQGKTGKVWFADLYRVMPMGVGQDLSPGYPLVSFYLSGKEIKLWFEILPLAKLVAQKNMFFQFSGAKVRYKLIALPLQAIASVTLDSGQAVNLSDSSTCYRVVTNVMVSEQLASAAKYSAGLLKIEPKLADCTTKIADLWQHVIDRDPQAAGLQQLKHWRAMVDYVGQLPDADGDGVPDLPQSYKTAQGRFVVD